MTKPKVQKPNHDHELCMRDNPIRGTKCECPCEMCRKINGPLNTTKRA